MSDHQAKIVSLAGEILRERNLCAQTKTSEKSRQKSYALKAACLSALLSASGAALGMHFYHEMQRPINHYERFEIEALLFYTAKRERQSLNALRKTTQKDLALPSLDDLSALDHRRIRDYLWTRLNG